MAIRSLSVAASLAIPAALLLPGGTAGQELRGDVSAEMRSFPQSPAFSGQSDAPLSPSVAFAPELLLDVGDVQLTFAPYLRVDGHDERRTHADVREASALLFGDGWTLFAGVGKVFWGKAEAHHLVDIVNQTDGVEDVDGEDKLGQPMVSFTLERPSGALDVMLLPYFRERTYPGEDGRLRGALPVREEAVYAWDLGRWHPDVAARWTHYLGNVDVAVSGFRGTSREPRLAPTVVSGAPILEATYDLIDQVAVEAQWTRGATLWKLEAMTRGGHGDRFAAGVLGVEHTLFGVIGAGDLGLLVEGMLDGRGPTAPYTAFDNDVFLGARWAFNDADDTSVLGGPVIDVETGELLAFLEAERRVAGRWTVAVEARWFANADPAGPLSGLRRDDFVTLRVGRYF